MSLVWYYCLVEKEAKLGLSLVESEVGIGFVFALLGYLTAVNVCGGCWKVNLLFALGFVGVDEGVTSSLTCVTSLS